MGDALLKYNMTAGNCADTALGKATQNLLLIPGESISNFCCDAAGMNFFMLPMVFDLFNTAQDAPKGQKALGVFRFQQIRAIRNRAKAPRKASC